MSEKIIIADASPLIAFGNINQISLLSNLFENIIVPEAVIKECVIDISQPGAIEIQKAINKRTIKVYANPGLQKYEASLDVLDYGEACAVALALDLQGGLLIDEKRGRAIATQLDIKIIGTLGALLLAKRKKLIKKISPLISELKKADYYLSARLVEEVLKRAKENL